MTDQFSHWPDEVAFRGTELDVILAGLDYAIELAPPKSPAWTAARRAQLVIWRKLWPELADHYDDPDDDGEA